MMSSLGTSLGRRNWSQSSSMRSCKCTPAPMSLSGLRYNYGSLLILIAPEWLISALIPNLCPLYVTDGTNWKVWSYLLQHCVIKLYLRPLCIYSSDCRGGKKSKQPFFSAVVRLRIRLNADCRHESFRRGDEWLLCTHEVIALSGVTDKGDSFCLRRWHRRGA